MVPLTRHGTARRGLAVPVLAMAAARLLRCLLRHRGGGRPGRAGPVAVRLCVAAVLLAGCGGPASTSAGASSSSPGTGSSQATAGAWRAADSGTRQPLYAVACLSASRCEAVGAAGTIRSTVDAGLTWRAQASPLPGSQQILYQIACVPPSSCYVIARPDTILVTHDAGATWSSRVLPLGGGANLTDHACLAGNEPALQARPAMCRLGLLDIACVSARVCYAVSTAPGAYGAAPRPAAAPPLSAIWMTSDGGASWARQSVPSGLTCAAGDCQPGLYPYPLTWISCLSSGLCRAGGWNFLDCGHCGYVAAVLASAGPGAPWTMLTCPGRAYQEICPTSSPDAGDCPTSARCYGAFSTSPFDPGTNVELSTDGGKDWQAVPSGSGSIRNDLACPAAQACYTVGDHGTITRTANGTAFVADRSPTAANLYGISCADTTVCYAVGDNGTILTLR